jgi:hypothetical protein
MNLIVEPAAGLQLHLSRSGHRITAIVSLRGLHLSVTHCEARDAVANTQGMPMLRLGDSSFSLPYGLLCEAADALGLGLDGGRA